MTTFEQPELMMQLKTYQTFFNVLHVEMTIKISILDGIKLSVIFMGNTQRKFPGRFVQRKT